MLPSLLINPLIPLLIMRKIIFSISLIFTILSSVFAQENSKFAVGLKTGYNNGFGIQTNFTVYDLVQDTPFHLRLAIGYTDLNPGISADARRIFINNATNGTPEKKGQTLDYRMDFLIPFNFLNDSFLEVGPRFSNFKGNFKYIGGNEDFDIVSNQWGFGVGAGNFFKINKRLELEISAGFDYFLATTLTGHDTSYSPDNENINPRDDNQNDNVEFTFDDADKAINQPKYTPHFMVGINYKL